MLGILSNSMRVATRETRWGAEFGTGERRADLPEQWREKSFHMFGKRDILDQAAEGARPKLFGW